MIRDEIKQYMNKNKDSMAYSHLEIYFTEQYQGVSKKECERKLKEEHDNGLLYEELEEKFESIKDIEKAKRILIQFEIPENLSLSTITNIMSKVNDRADINTDIIFGTKTNKNLEEDEIFIRVLMSGL